MEKGASSRIYLHPLVLPPLLTGPLHPPKNLEGEDNLRKEMVTSLVISLALVPTLLVALAKALNLSTLKPRRINLVS